VVFRCGGLEGNVCKNPLFGLSIAFIEIQGVFEEPMTRFELVTSYLPSKIFINYISILQGFCNLIVTLFT